jgi:hypothetical protein
MGISQNPATAEYWREPTKPFISHTNGSGMDF